MVNLPVVTWLFSANSWSVLIGSVWDTEMVNRTFDFVYSCPG